MTTIEIKTRINKLLDQADDRLLQMIYAMLREDDKTIVAHTTEGKPLTRKAYKKELELSHKEIKQGNTITLEDLEKEIEQW